MSSRSGKAPAPPLRPEPGTAGTHVRETFYAVRAVSFPRFVTDSERRRSTGWRINLLNREMVMIRETRNAPAGLDLIVVGGGLAGLTAAALVAREGRSVAVLERAGHLGGR